MVTLQSELGLVSEFCMFCFFLCSLVTFHFQKKKHASRWISYVKLSCVCGGGAMQ